MKARGAASHKTEEAKSRDNQERAPARTRPAKGKVRHKERAYLSLKSKRRPARGVDAGARVAAGGEGPRAT